MIAQRTVDRSNDLRAATTNPFLVDPGPSFRDRLGEIAVPTLVVHGDDDPLFPLAHGEALAREIPDAELLVIPEPATGCRRSAPGPCWRTAWSR